MGRKGMKGFLKEVHKQHGSENEAAKTPTEQASTFAPKPAATPEQPGAQEAKQTTHKLESSDSDSDDGEPEAKGPETRGQMLQRHKREMVAHKKAMQKLGSKKKGDVAKLTTDIETRHTQQLAELAERDKQQQEVEARDGMGPADGVAEGLEVLALGAVYSGEDKKLTKARKRREKVAQQETERERRIADEQAALGPSDKAREEEQLQALLLPLMLGVREIRADGHCLYRSLEDQLMHATKVRNEQPTSVPDYLALRHLAAVHIRSHVDDFLPFILDDSATGSPEEQLETYCAELEGTAAWGGHLELSALAQALKKQIKVYAAGLPMVTLGDEYACSGGVLQLCYLRHAFGLGAHYNSVVPQGVEDG